MNRWGIVGFAHWFVAVGFLTLRLTLVNAYGQLFKADWVLPSIGDLAAVRDLHRVHRAS